MAQPPSARSFKGFVILINVLAVAIVGSTIVISLLWLAIGSSSNHVTLLNSMQTRNLANACVEVALQEIRNNTSYSGSDVVSINDIECSYTVTILPASAREITASSTYNNVVKKIKVLASQVDPAIIISSWQEVADF